jgi:hypothetical protein
MVAATVEVVGAVANLVTIAVAVPQVRELVRRTIRWALRRPEVTNSADEVVVTIRFPSGTEKTVPLNADSAQVEVVAKAIADGSNTKPGGK